MKTSVKLSLSFTFLFFAFLFVGYFLWASGFELFLTLYAFLSLFILMGIFIFMKGQIGYLGEEKMNSWRYVFLGSILLYTISFAYIAVQLVRNSSQRFFHELDEIEAISAFYEQYHIIFVPMAFLLLASFLSILYFLYPRRKDL